MLGWSRRASLASSTDTIPKARRRATLGGGEVGEDAGGDGGDAVRTGVTDDGADRDLTAVEAVGIEFPAEEEEIGGAHTVDGTDGEHHVKR